MSIHFYITDFKSARLFSDNSWVEAYLCEKWTTWVKAMSLSHVLSIFYYNSWAEVPVWINSAIPTWTQENEIVVRCASPQSAAMIKFCTNTCTGKEHLCNAYAKHTFTAEHSAHWVSGVFRFNRV